MADFETSVDLDINAFLPDQYIRNEMQRLDIYKRIAQIRSDEDYDDMQDELIDRFGEIPVPVQNLLRAARLRSLAHEVYVTEVTGNRDQIRLTMYQQAPVDPARIPQLLKPYRGDLKLTTGEVPGFVYTDQRKQMLNTDKMLECVKNLLNDIKMLIDE